MSLCGGLREREFPERKYSTGNDRFGFNGQEKTPEISNGHTTAQFWEYDSRVARRWNVDPRPVTSISPYNVFQGNPIFNTDPKGDTIFASKIDKTTKNVAVIHLKPGEDHKLGPKWEGNREGWSYIVTDDVEEANKWIQNNFSSDEVENLAVRFHSSGTSKNIEGIAIWDENGIRSTMSPQTLAMSNPVPARDQAQHDALLGIIGIVKEGGTIVLAPCDLACGDNGIGNADLEFVLGMSKISSHNSITIMMNTVPTHMYATFNKEKYMANLSGKNTLDPYTWIKYQRFDNSGMVSTRKYSVFVANSAGFFIFRERSKNK